MSESITVIEGVEGFEALAGQEAAVSEWRTIDQAQVNAFADATGDHQWIHTDPERAKDSPFGGTIVHGYFILSLHPSLLYSAIEVRGHGSSINYGLNKVRFVSPLPTGSRVRLRIAVASVDRNDGGWQVTWNLTWEREGGDKPVCVAETISRYRSA
ncbi:MaoC family dehydratase [Patulibacter minatonensis]|uniref:MaoC family dehydratase n=1 Tax=Patulibacter minatonensis TaxID=298163 RepID=UPI0004B34DA0|nr:MaoC family dehydratase [Patulibacter minatonensis]